MAEGNLLFLQHRQLRGRDAGFAYFRNGTDAQFAVDAARTADDRHDPLLRQKELLLGEDFQRIVEPKTLLLGPVVIPAQQRQIALFDEVSVSSAGHRLG